MRQRIRAMLLALGLALSLGAVPVLADQTPQPEQAVQEPAEAEQSQQEDETAPAEDAEEAAPADSPAGPDQETVGEDMEIVPDPVGTVSFENLERRIREHNLQLLALEENVASLEGMDYEAMQEHLRKSMHNMAQSQWNLRKAAQLPEDSPYYVEWDPYAYTQMSQGYDALRDQFDAIRDGELQKDNAGVIRQLKNLQDQIVMSGETLYMAIYAMETQESALQRQLAAMNRTVEEMELRYELGPVSYTHLTLPTIVHV